MADDMYTDQIIEYYKHPVNFGRLEPADIEASGGNPGCGDQVVWTLRLENDRVAEILFTGRGCAISRASACIVSELVKGKTLDEIRQIQKTDVLLALGGIVQTRLSCALLPLNALCDGITKYREREERLDTSGPNRPVKK